MEYRILGTDGPRVSVIGLGAFPLGGALGAVETDTAIATVRAAIDSGITLIDSAEGYGRSETVLGQALQGGYRERCFLATKATHVYTPEGIRAAFEASLKALRTDVIDLYQIHHWRPEYPLDAAMETMARLREAGKVRFIGVSNFMAPQLGRARAYAPVQSDQLCYNLFQRADSEHTDFPYCRREGIGVIVHSVLAKGLLTGKYDSNHRFSPTDDQRAEFAHFQGDAFATYVTAAAKLKALALECGLTPIRIALAWALRDSVVASVLVGAKAPGQIADYLPAAETTLAPEVLARIDAILADVPPIPDRNRKKQEA